MFNSLQGVRFAWAEMDPVARFERRGSANSSELHLPFQAVQGDGSANRVLGYGCVCGQDQANCFEPIRLRKRMGANIAQTLAQWCEAGNLAGANVMQSHSDSLQQTRRRF